jgi:hypothetical protein
MSSTGFTELVQSISAPSTPTSSIISPPENTPVDNITPEHLLTPQLAIKSLLMAEDTFSSVNYDRCHGSAGTPLGTHANGEASRSEEARSAIRM